MKYTLLVMVCILISAVPSEAQFWKKLKKNVEDKISERVVDKVENEIAEDIADRAMKKIDNLYEDLWRKSYNDANGEDLNEEEFEVMISEMGDDLTEALGELNKAADVPDRYDFNVIVDYAATDESGKETSSEIYFSRTDGIMGLLGNKENKDVIIVMDADNDLMVYYSEKNGKKTAQAIPALFTMASALSMTSEESTTYRLPMKATGVTKSISGYRSKEYKGEDEDSSFLIYMSTEIPFDWRKSYGELLKSVIPNMYEENEEKLEGMMMKVIDTNKKNGKTSHWEVNKISNMRTSIIKSDYEFNGVEN